MDSKLVIQNAVRFILLMLFQILILNNVNLSGYAIPYLYIMFILMLPTYTGKVSLLLCAFACGFCMDVFSNMLGFHTFSCTLIGLLRIAFADRILTRNEAVDIAIPSIHAVKPQYFVGYLLVLTGAFYFVFYSLELFGSEGMGRLLLSVILSTLLTSVMVLLAQMLFLKRPQR